MGIAETMAEEYAQIKREYPYSVKVEIDELRRSVNGYFTLDGLDAARNWLEEHNVQHNIDFYFRFSRFWGREFRFKNAEDAMAFKLRWE